MALLVLDEQLANARLVAALGDRGVNAATVGDYGVTGRADADVVRRIDDQTTEPWVFVSMDLTIMEDSPGFDWSRYALAWISLRKDLLGAAVERQKIEIVHRHAHLIREQTPGDHFTYTASQHFKHAPSLATQLRKPRW